MNKKNWKILEKENAYTGFYKIHRYKLQHDLFKGGQSEPILRELIIRYRVAATLPYDPILNKVILIEQFRIGALENEQGPWLLEMTAGIRTDSEETLEELAKRETFEEAGLLVQKLIPMCDYWVSPGGSQERVALFLGIVDAPQTGGVYGLPEENEDILVHVLDTQEAFEAVRAGKINNAATIIALQWLELNLLKNPLIFAN